MRYLPLVFTASPALANPGAPDHDAGWFSVIFGVVLSAASLFVLVRQ